MVKTKRKAIRNPVTEKIEFYQGSKTIGIREPVSGKIIRRIKKGKGFF